MKIQIAGLLLAIALVAHADDFKTLDGKDYKGVKISAVEPDSVTVTTDSGVEKIPFANLPPDVQKRYGYDPVKAYQFQKAIYDAYVQKKAQEKAAEDAQNAAIAAMPEPTPSLELTDDDIQHARKEPVYAAVDLAATYDNNGVSASHDFDNKIGPVRGTITDISKDVLGYPSVTLNDAVVCEFPKGHESDLLALDKGQTVVIIGHVMGNNLGYTLMNKCVLAQ